MESLIDDTFEIILSFCSRWSTARQKPTVLWICVPFLSFYLGAKWSKFEKYAHVKFYTHLVVCLFHNAQNEPVDRFNSI